MNLKLLNWNVRGINNLAKRQVVLLFISSLECNFVCLQETKVEVVTRALVIENLGPRFGDNFIFLPADGTRGGILIACSDDFSITDEPMAVGCFSLTG
jgi:exonuclease III